MTQRLARGLLLGDDERKNDPPLPVAPLPVGFNKVMGALDMTDAGQDKKTGVSAKAARLEELATTRWGDGMAPQPDEWDKRFSWNAVMCIIGHDANDLRDWRIKYHGTHKIMQVMRNPQKGQKPLFQICVDNNTFRA